MPLTIVASVSLLALVVTGRPLLPQDFPHDPLVQPSGKVQNAVQAIFYSRIGSGNLKLDDQDKDDRIVQGDIQVRLTSSDLQSAYLSQLSSDDVKLVVPLGDNVLGPTNDEMTLYNALEGLNDLDGGILPLEDVLSDYDEQDAEDMDDSIFNQMDHTSDVTSTNSARPLPALLVMSAASLFILSSLAIIMYVLILIRDDVLSRRFAWDLWPCIARDFGLEGNAGTGVGFKEKGLVLGVEDEGELADEKIQSIQNAPQSESGEGPPEDVVSSREEDEDEVFEDASDYPDPDLLPLPTSIPVPTRSPLRRPLQMRENPSNPPSWSIQASTLSLSSVTPTSVPQSTPDVDHLDPLARRRAYRDPLQESDLALVFQMHPGFGLGADTTWLVRFVIGVFGWFTVLVSGGRREDSRRLIQA